MPMPYETNEELVEDQVRWLAAWVRGDEPGSGALARLQATVDRQRFPVLWLQDRLGLTDTEMRVVWVLIGHELDPDVRAIVRAANTEEVSDPTFDTIRRLIYGPAARLRVWRELGPEGHLRTLGLIERTDGAAQAPEQRQTFKASQRVLALAFGDPGIDHALSAFARIDGTWPELGQLVVDADARRRVEEAVQRASGLVIVAGRSGSGRRSLLAACVRKRMLVIDARGLSRKRDEARGELALVMREARLLDCVPLIRNVDALLAEGDAVDRTEVLDDLSGLVLATSTIVIRRRWKVSPVQLELPRLSAGPCAELWKRALPEASESDADHLATMYPLAPALIEAAGRAAQAARVAAGDRDSMLPEHVEAGIRSVLDDRLAGLATRVTVSQSWSDLIVPEDQLTAIIELLARIRERRRVYEDWGFADKLGRGLGVTALFSGPPGTGKTMAAGLIAKDLGCDLYRVDTSKISSKWLGETEKNLAALFDAAEAGHAILLFDEADALFGKRTEVKSSNDRHANQETNYLLQRIESYGGIVMLTTNHESAIDEAFRRRLSVHVRLPVPDVEERKRLWRALLPEKAPVGGELGVESLAEGFAMSGGYIRNAVLRAAFLAADESTRIERTHLLRAARLEYEALGKVVAATSH